MFTAAVIWGIWKYLDAAIVGDFSQWTPYLLGTIAWVIIFSDGYICKHERLPGIIALTGFYLMWSGIAIAFGSAALYLWHEFM